MEEEPQSNDRAEITRYLLGDLAEAEKVRLEERYVVDERFFEAVSAAEAELVNDYLEGRLSTRDRQLFEDTLAAQADRRNKVEWGKQLRELIARQGSQAPIGRDPAQRSWHFALAAALVICAASLLLLLNMYQRNSRLQEETGRLESELAQLQAERPLAQASSLASITLEPGVQRGASSSSNLRMTPQTAAVQFELRFRDRQDYPAYQAAISTVDQGQVLGKIEFSQDGEASSVRLTLPASLLPVNDYLITLKGAREDGSYEDIDSYFFRVVAP